MSLTREQWVEMWKSIKKIEAQSYGLISEAKKKIILAEVKKIKKQIQEVIGQME